jgi:hypothetical protein
MTDKATKISDSIEHNAHLALENLVLHARAYQEREKRSEPNRYIANWYGRRGGSSRREYVYYICNATIDTEAAAWKQTKHATEAIEKHRRKHLQDPEQWETEQTLGLDL